MPNYEHFNAKQMGFNELSNETFDILSCFILAISLELISNLFGLWILFSNQMKSYRTFIKLLL